MNISFYDAVVSKIIIHKVGNKLRQEEVELSNGLTQVDDQTLELLKNQFFLSFKSLEWFQFYHPIEIKFNEINSICNSIFESKTKFNDGSKNIATHLYENSEHPKIKSGELAVVLFDKISVDDKSHQAIGLFKIEDRDSFIQIDGDSNIYNIKSDKGINLSKVEKACLIININENDGYRVVFSDFSNRSANAQYWKDDFLKVKPVSDEFHNTKNFLQIAKTFVVNQLPEDFEVDKPRQIDMLNKSIDFFKKHDMFDKEEFEKEIFGDQEVITSFNSFYDDFKEKNNVELEDSFEISTQAVKKQARIFKSVLKLDKNFHIYIHGDRKLIEKGTEEDGRKYYKIYYTDEE